jgi:hypothetical protein
MRYTEEQLDDIVDRISRISITAQSIEQELRNKNYAADEEYAFAEDLDLIVREAMKLELDME